MLDGKRVAILVEEDFEDSELVEPLRSMKDAGSRVIVVGSGTQDIYHGKRGVATVKVDTSAGKVKAAEFDAVIVPGGGAPDRMRLHESMVKMVRQAHEAGKVVAAVCHGPQLLISADIVRGHKVTSYPAIAGELRDAGAEWVDKPVVRDGKIITSRRPADLPKFNKAIIQALKEETQTE